MSASEKEYSGARIIGFKPAILFDTLHGPHREKTGCITFRLHDNSTRIVKFRMPVIKSFRDTFQQLDFSSSSRERDRVLRIISNEKSLSERFLEVEHHPISTHIINTNSIPDQPKEIDQISDKSYVKFIAITDHQDLLRFDLTFMDDTVEIFSLHPFVAIYLLDDLVSVCRELEALNNAH